jgi:predicted permease
MWDLYADMRREWEEEGRGGPVRFWLALGWDALSGAAAAWTSRDLRTKRRTRGEIMSTVLQDFRYALRQLRRQPLFSATIVVLVAIGIAGNAAVFRVFNGLFLRPLPFPEAQQLVDLDVTAPEWDLDYVSVSIRDYRDWTEGNRSFASLATFFLSGGNLSVDGGAERVSYVMATHTLDDVLQLEPARGRFFTEAEDQPDAPLVALLSAGFWERSFASDPDVVGRTFRLDGQEVEVIGVLPASAGFLGDADLWIPLREDDDSSYYLVGIGRLLDGVTPGAAQDDLVRVHRAQVEERPVNAVTSPLVQPLRDRYLGNSRLGSTILFAAVAVVLLIACANIAGLMFARAVGRTREVAVRRALGATRSRLVRQLLTESVVLASLGGFLGAMGGLWASTRLLGILGDQFPPWVTFDLDPRFLGFLVAATAGAALVFGLFPALRASRRDPRTVSRGTSSARTRRGLRLLVGGEVALAALLLVVAGLLSADMRSLSRVDPGFDTADLLTWRIQLTGTQYPSSEERLAFAEAYRERLRRIPGATAVALSTNLPLMGHSGWFLEVEGAGDPDDGQDAPASPVVLRRWATPGYFEAMGVPILQGRAFDEFDGREEGSRVAVVNEAFVRTHVPAGTDPVGQRLRVRGGEEDAWITIVGVGHDVLHYGVDQEMRPGIYEPLRQGPGAFLQVAVRSTLGAAELRSAARAATAEVDPELALFDVETMAARFDESLLARRSNSWMVGIFSAVALLLAGAGLYGVISYSVGQRRQEIGIRMAMGARADQVGRGVVQEGMVIAAIGLALGLGAAVALGGLVSGALVGTAPSDLRVYLGVAVLLLGVAALANWMPARRAARLSPMTTLRNEG